MPAGVYNFTLEVGADFDLPVEVTQGSVEAPEPRPLTDFTARMQIRQTYASDTALISLSTETTGITIDEDDGIINIEIPGAVSTAVTGLGTTIKKGVYDLEMVAPDGSIERVLKGKVKLDPEVTRCPLFTLSRLPLLLSTRRLVLFV